MGKPKKRTTPRRTGNRRSHHFLKLANRVNAISPVNVTWKKSAVKTESDNKKVEQKETALKQ